MTAFLPAIDSKSSFLIIFLYGRDSGCRSFPADSANLKTSELPRFRQAINEPVTVFVWCEPYQSCPVSRCFRARIQVGRLLMRTSSECQRSYAIATLIHFPNKLREFNCVEERSQIIGTTDEYARIVAGRPFRQVWFLWLSISFQPILSFEP